MEDVNDVNNVDNADNNNNNEDTYNNGGLRSVGVCNHFPSDDDIVEVSRCTEPG